MNFFRKEVESLGSDDEQTGTEYKDTNRIVRTKINSNLKPQFSSATKSNNSGNQPTEVENSVTQFEAAYAKSKQFQRQKTLEEQKQKEDQDTTAELEAHLQNLKIEEQNQSPQAQIDDNIGQFRQIPNFDPMNFQSTESSSQSATQELQLGKKRSSFLQPPPNQKFLNQANSIERQLSRDNEIGDLISLPSDDDVKRANSKELLSLDYDPGALKNMDNFGKANPFMHYPSGNNAHNPGNLNEPVKQKTSFHTQKKTNPFAIPDQSPNQMVHVSDNQPGSIPQLVAQPEIQQQQPNLLIGNRPFQPSQAQIREQRELQIAQEMLGLDPSQCANNFGYVYKSDPFSNDQN